jgi:hypothetical protein
MRAIPKLPQARLYLKAAQWGIDEMVKQQAYGSGYRFFLVGILASLRAVQHALYNHDRELSPEHRAAIDQWWKRTTPSDKPELAFIVDARNQILKGGAFQSYAISSESGIGEGDNYTVTATEYELSYIVNGEYRDLLADLRKAADWCDKELASIEARLPQQYETDDE